MHGKNIYLFFHSEIRYLHKRSAAVSGFRFSIRLLEKRLIKYIYNIIILQDFTTRLSNYSTLYICQSALMNIIR